MFRSYQRRLIKDFLNTKLNKTPHLFMNFKYFKISLLIASTFLYSCSEFSEEAEENAILLQEQLEQEELEGGASRAITFNRDVAPIISSNCVECHSGAGAQGGVRLENFEQVSASIVRVNARMNDRNNPMPPGSLIGIVMRQTVMDWIDGGLLEGDSEDVEETPIVVEEVIPPVVVDPTPTPVEPPVTTPEAEPTLVTFSNTISAIIVDSCVECHRGAGARAGVRLENFEQVRAITEAGRTVARINNESAPMPPAGLLPLETRELFDAWVSNGLAEN